MRTRSRSSQCLDGRQQVAESAAGRRRDRRHADDGRVIGDVARRRVAGAVDLVPGENGRRLAGTDLVEHALDDRDLLLGLGIGGVDDVQQQLGAAAPPRACS